MAGVELLFGPMLVGAFLNTMLYGVLVVQIFLYFQTYKRDAAWIRYFILFLLITETMNTGFDIGMLYEPLVVRYGTERAVTVAPIMLSADPVMTVAISTPIQIFVGWRIRVISKSVRAYVAITFFAICAFIGGIATTVMVTIIPEYARLQEFSPAVIVWLASSAVADVLITTSLVYSLYTRRTGFAATDSIINRIIRLTVQTGMITACAAIVDVTLFLAVPKTTLNFAWDFALCKLYSNALLSTLNARGGWSKESGGNDNVLFGRGDGTSGGVASSTAASWRPTQVDPKLQAENTYELEAAPAVAAARKFDRKSAQSLEDGIVVTTVVGSFVDGQMDRDAKPQEQW